MLTQGGELFERVAERGGLPEQEVTGYFWQILDAVAHCHSQSVCHRDRECATAFLILCLSLRFHVVIACFLCLSFADEASCWDPVGHGVSVGGWNYNVSTALQCWDRRNSMPPSALQTASR